MVPRHFDRGAKLGRRLLGGVVAAALLATAATATTPKTTDVPAAATARIPVESLGFVPPSRFFMPYRVPAATLDFLDSTHLLFTFHVALLMRREPEDPKDDQDQTIRAVVLSVPEGKVTAEGTWRLHDRERYLWMLQGGHFLVRQRNTLLEGDSTLVLKEYLHPEGALASVQLSPDAGTLVAQYAHPVKSEEEGDGRPSGAPTLGDDAPKFTSKEMRYRILVIDTEKKTATRGGELGHAVVLPMVEGGYLGVNQGKGKQWNVILKPFEGEPHVVASVASTCQPTVASLSEHVFLTRSCLPLSADGQIDAFDLEGHKLWQQIWQSRFAWGTFAYSGAGNRFAYGSIEVNHSLSELDPIDESSIVGQPVGVFDVHTGKMDAVVDAVPVLTAGENFALSPDGNRFAVLRKGAIEIYDLPPVPAPGPIAATSTSRLP